MVLLFIYIFDKSAVGKRSPASRIISFIVVLPRMIG